MMRNVFIPLFFCSVIAFAGDVDEIAELTVKCEQEKSAPFSGVWDIPSCDMLKDIQKKRKVPSDGTLTYRWNGMKGRYCYYNEAGEETMCP